MAGYKIEYRIGSGNYQTVTKNTASTATQFIHQSLDEDEKYSYRVYAINSEGTVSVIKLFKNTVNNSASLSVNL